MKYSFDPESDLVRITVQIHGFQLMEECIFALDTGATRTMIDPDVLVAAGYDPARPFQVHITTGISGPVTMGLLRVAALRCLGRSLTDFPVLVHRLPTSIGASGLLGLDFLRQGGVHIDFRSGAIELD